MVRTFVSLVGVGVAMIAAIVAFSFGAQTSFSQSGWTQVDLTGWAWAGAEGSGWISLNCKTVSESGGDVCSQSNYGVKIKKGATELPLEGYAWSPALGWIKFGNLSGFPGAGGNAKITVATGKVSGWVRVCNGTADRKCGTSADNTDDAWDGWISLTCENVGECAASKYGLKVGEGRIDSSARFSWGQNPIGWTDWSAARFDSPCDSGQTCNADGYVVITDQWCNVTVTDELCSGGDVPPVELVSFVVEPSVVRAGNTVNISWEVKDASSCTVKGTNGDEWFSEGDASHVVTNGDTPVESSGLLHTSDFYIECMDTGTPAKGPDELARKTVRVVPTYDEI